MGGVRKINLQDVWCRRGQYRMDYTNSPLSTGWVVLERTINTGPITHTQVIIYRMGGVGRNYAG